MKVGSDTAVWLVVCGVLVSLMAPALACFYGAARDDAGRRANVVSILVRWVLAIPILGLQWTLFGYSLAFGPTRHGLVGRLAYAALSGGIGRVWSAVPTVVFEGCRMTLAVSAPALISGALGAKMKLSAYVAFILFWSTLVFDPVAHWVWAAGGWLSHMGVADFAGGIVVHFAIGIGAIVCSRMVGNVRVGPMRRLPHLDTTTVLASTGALCLGWFALDAAHALGDAHFLTLSLETTGWGAMGGGLVWGGLEWVQRGRPTAVGVATGVVSGLVGVTAGAGFVAPSAALAIGVIAGAIGYGTGLGVASGLIAGLLAITAAAGHVEPVVAIAIACIAGAICHAAVHLRGRFGFASSPDPFGVHGVGGLAGALLIGVFAQRGLNRAGADGALFGNMSQLAVQAIACLGVGVYVAVVSLAILKLIDATLGLRLPQAIAREIHPDSELASDPPTARARAGPA